jgi:hypothetical protein
VKRILIPCLLMTLAACGDDDDDLRQSTQRDSGTDQEPGVCTLTACPSPEMGNACCTPYAKCGYDPTGLGLACLPNPGDSLSDRQCVLAECAEPIVGQRCCTPYGECGFDPFESGIFCFPFPEEIPPYDSGVPACEVSSCDTPEAGAACCQLDGECGVDPFGIGICYPIEALDGGVVLEPISTTPPDDPSVDGQCPSYIGLLGYPIWGCCSDFGVCGTFLGETCFLPEGTLINIDPDADAGALGPLLGVCNPPD